MLNAPAPNHGLLVSTLQNPTRYYADMYRPVVTLSNINSRTSLTLGQLQIEHNLRTDPARARTVRCDRVDVDSSSVTIYGPTLGNLATLLDVRRHPRPNNHIRRPFGG